MNITQTDGFLWQRRIFVIAALFLVCGVLPFVGGLAVGNFSPDWQWAHVAFHSFVESFGSLMAIAIAVFIMARTDVKSRNYMLPLACSMLAIGILNGFHACVDPGVEFVWLHSTAQFAGGLFIAMVWLPKHFMRKLSVKWLPSLLAIAFVLIGVISISFPEVLPAMLVSGKFTLAAKMLNIIGGAAFLSGGIYFALRFYRNGDVTSLLFSSLCFLFGVAGITFESSVLWDGGWWMWHLMQLAAYIIALGYIAAGSASEYRRTIQAEATLQAKSQQLSAANQQLTANEHQLRAANQQLDASNQQLQAHEQQLRAVNQQLNASNQQLQASRDQYSSLINNIPGVTYRCKLDKDWTMLYMSSAVDQISGYPASDFIKNAVRTYESVIHREDAEYVDQKINGAVESGAPWEIEYRVCHKNGSIRWAYEKGRCVVGKDGKVEFLDGFILDITARKQAEEALRENLQRLEFALQGGELGMWDWNPEDDAVVYNNSWAQILEYRPDELEPTVDFFKQHIHPEDMAAVFDRLTGHVEGRLPVYESEHRLRTKSGRWLWVLDRGKIVERDKDGCPVRVTGIIADITDRKRSEETLRESEARFMKVLYASDDAILLIGDNTFIDCNEATVSMLGYDSREQFLQTHPSELSPETQPDGRSSLKKADEMMRLAFDRGFHRFEWIHLRANGEEFPVEVSLTRIAHKGRHILYCIWRDITEHKASEAEREKTIAEMERMNRLMMGREMRIIEMKKEVNALLTELGREPQYGSVLEGQEVEYSSDKTGGKHDL